MLNSPATQTAASGGLMQMRRRQEFLPKSLNASEPEESTPALYFPDNKFIFLHFYVPGWETAGHNPAGRPAADN